GRQGVLATAGWRRGMKTTLLRAIECINHHVYVHTHGARLDEGLEAIAHAEATGWMPPLQRETAAGARSGESAADCSGARGASCLRMCAVAAEGAPGGGAGRGERQAPRQAAATGSL